MDQHVMLIVQSAASVFTGILMLVALFLLWSKSKSTWLLLALAGISISLLFRLAYAVVPTFLSIAPMMPLLWSVTGLLVAAGLLGYALDESKRHT